MAGKKEKDLSGNPLGVDIAGKANAAVEKALEIARDSEKNIDRAIQYAENMLRIANILVDKKLTDKRKVSMISAIVIQSSKDVEV